MSVPPDTLTYDPIELNGIENKPCEVVPLTGYLRKGAYDRDRHYTDRTFRTWMEIDRTDIEAQSPIADKDGATTGRSVVWVKRDATIVRCEAVLASAHDGQHRPGDEDLGAFRYPY